MNRQFPTRAGGHSP